MTLRRFLLLQLYDYGVSFPEAIEKIATDLKDHHKSTFINNSKKVAYQDSHIVVKKMLKLHTKKSNDCPMMSFIHSEKETRIYRILSGNKLDGIASYKTA